MVLQDRIKKNVPWQCLLSFLSMDSHLTIDATSLELQLPQTRQMGEACRLTVVGIHARLFVL